MMRKRMIAGFGLVPALVLVMAGSGCTVLTYSSPSGERFSRASLGANTAVASLSIDSGTNGARRVELQGYQNDSAQALGAVTEAAVRAAIQSAP